MCAAPRRSKAWPRRPRARGRGEPADEVDLLERVERALDGRDGAPERGRELRRRIALREVGARADEPARSIGIGSGRERAGSGACCGLRGHGRRGTRWVVAAGRLGWTHAHTAAQRRGCGGSIRWMMGEGRLPGASGDLEPIRWHRVGEIAWDAHRLHAFDRSRCEGAHRGIGLAYLNSAYRWPCLSNTLSTSSQNEIMLRSPSRNALARSRSNSRAPNSVHS